MYNVSSSLVSLCLLWLCLSFFDLLVEAFFLFPWRLLNAWTDELSCPAESSVEEASEDERSPNEMAEGCAELSDSFVPPDAAWDFAASRLDFARLFWNHTWICLGVIPDSFDSSFRTS